MKLFERTAQLVALLHSGPLGRRRAAAAVVLLPLALLGGCGTIGAPSPPSLALPVPVIDLAASRTANTVHLAWTMPRRTTDKLLIKNVLTVHICRKLESGPCVVVGDPQFAGNKPASFDDTLPPELSTGPPKLLTYTIEVRNRAGHAAGASNAAFSTAGSVPLPLTGLTAEVRTDGIVLQWHPASIEGQKLAIRIHRTLIPKPAGPSGKPTKSSLANGAPPPADETLVVQNEAGSDPGKALDPSAAFDQTYVYHAERLTSLSLNAHTVEVQGASSDKVTVVTRDVFPPRPPQGLAVVTVPAEHAIDLSWNPDTEPDLAGYFVFRRDIPAGGVPEKISPQAPIATPSFRDAGAEPGHTYAYSVSAIDEDGNESARSAEEQETLPKPQP
jgi:hypothetical protein